MAKYTYTSEKVMVHGHTMMPFDIARDLNTLDKIRRERDISDAILKFLVSTRLISKDIVKMMREMADAGALKGISAKEKS